MTSSVKNLQDQVRLIANNEWTTKQGNYESLSSNQYRRALFEILLDLKYQKKEDMESFTFYHQSECSRTRNALDENLSHSDLQIGDMERKDEELQQAEDEFRRVVDIKRMEIEKHDSFLTLKAEAMQLHMEQTLKSQMNHRPIDQTNFQQAKHIISLRYDQAKNDVRQHMINELLITRTKLAENRKRRKNFGKEALDILQEYYQANINHPYPSDDDKAKLADQCNISIQQVANWFGNRRIRDKKAHNIYSEENFSRGNDYCPNYRSAPAEQ